MASINNQSSLTIRDVDSLKRAILYRNQEESLLARKVRACRNIVQPLDSNLERTCYNIEDDDDTGKKTKNRFKYIINGRITRGDKAYQYMSNRIKLTHLEMRLYTNMFHKVQESLAYNRGVRITLVYFKDFKGDIDKIPTFKSFFSGYNGYKGEQTSIYSLSDVSSVYFDSCLVLYDRYTHIGAYSCFENNGVINRTVGNCFFEERIDLAHIETVFSVIEVETQDPLLLYKNIQTGLFVMYFSCDFMDNPNEDDRIGVTGNFRLGFISA